MLSPKARSMVLEHKELINKIISFEEEKQEYFTKNSWQMAWDYADIQTDPKILYKLFINGILTMPYGTSGKTKSYSLKDREYLKNAINELSQIVVVTEKERESPDDLFDIIIGYEDIKQIFRQSIKSNSPTHILLEGPPASAKSLFLMEIERLEGSIFCLGGTSTRAGIRDLIFELPLFLIIDEIDKINSSGDLSSLLSWMESGRITITKHDMHEEILGKGWVFAACNRSNKLPPELKDRFLHFILKEYSSEEYQEIVYKMLVKREQVNEELALYIAEKVCEWSNSVRDAIKIARLCSTKEEVIKVITTIRKYQ